MATRPSTGRPRGPSSAAGAETPRNWRIEVLGRQRGVELGPRAGIRLDTARALECCACRASAELPERPGGMTAHQRLAIGERGDQRRYGCGVPAVAEGDGGVSQQPPTPGARDGRAAEARPEGGVVEREQVG